MGSLGVRVTPFRIPMRTSKIQPNHPTNHDNLLDTPNTPCYYSKTISSDSPTVHTTICCVWLAEYRSIWLSEDVAKVSDGM